MVDDSGHQSDSQPPVTAVVIVDHGSRKSASNDMLLKAVISFAEQSEYAIVEPAHMELAEPDITSAFRRCVEQGAERVIVFPYFLSPGRHWSADIPRLVSQAAQPFPGVTWLVTAPFGLHSGMSAIISDRIQYCLNVAEGTANADSCDVCRESGHCQIHRGGAAT